MSYTLKNLGEVEDMAPQHGMGDFQEARFAGGSLGAERTGLALMTVKPGRHQPMTHHHEDAEEVYVVVSGSGRAWLDGEIVELGPLDALRVAPSVKRSFAAGSEGLTYIALGARHPGDGGFDRSDPWADAPASGQ